jgi:hypothetical protein
VPEWYDCVGNLPRDFAAFGGLIIDSETMPVVVGVSTLTLGLVVTDDETYKYSRRVYQRSGTIKSVSDVFVSVGDGGSSLVVAGIFGAYGLAAADRRAVRTASQTLEALLATGILVQTFKRMAGRESPSVATREGGKWRPFPSFKAYHDHQSEYYAFPSGHIATTMASVVVIAENYPEQKWIRPVGYSLVGLVGIGLVNYRWHWYSDLPLGIAIGYAFGKIASRHQGVTANNHRSPGLTFAPMVDEFGKGVRISLHF